MHTTLHITINDFNILMYALFSTFKKQIEGEERK